MSGAGRRLLVVDDDRHMVKTLSDIFSLRGWEVGQSFSGNEAVEAVKAEKFDVVLMDILMPGMSGVEALRAIRASNPKVRVVLMTAYTANELIEQATREGAVKVLFKPVAVPELLTFLEREAEAGDSVLIVDDDPAFLRTLASNLTQEGYSVHLAADLDSALRLIDERVPGVVVLDLRLGDMEPREGILAIKKMHPSVILILCSGYPRLLDATEQDVPFEWVYARLEKPFPPDRLLDLLDAV